MSSEQVKSAKLIIERAARSQAANRKALKARLKRWLDRQPVRDAEDACYIRSSN